MTGAGRLHGLHRLRTSLLALALSWGSLLVPYHRSEAALPPEACRPGFVQHDPIALGCRGNSKSIKFDLTEVGTPHHLLLWQAPAGTQNLRVTATLKPPNGGRGRAALKVACVGNGKVLVGRDTGALNRNTMHAQIESAHWQWGGDSSARYGESFEEWFRVNGTLPCDVEVSLSNEHTTRLLGDLQYEWTHIEPCPAVPLGCRPCSEEQGTCTAEGEVAVCDGSAFVQCKTQAAFKAANDALEHGCCFNYDLDAEGSFMDPTPDLTQGECVARQATTPRGYVGWNTSCPKDAQEADMWRKAHSLPVQEEADATTNTMAAATTTALPAPSVDVPMTYELAGAFALEVKTSLSVSSDAFHQMLLTALAESIGIHSSAFMRFKVVAVGGGDAAGRRVEAAAGSPEAIANKIVGVGYEVAAGSAARQVEIQIRLNNMAGQGSRVRASLAAILSRSQVGLLAVEVTYPPAAVSESGLLPMAASTSLRAGGGVALPTAAPSLPAPTSIPDPWVREIRKDKPAWTSTAGVIGVLGAALCGLAAIGCFCLCLGISRLQGRKTIEVTTKEGQLQRDGVGPQAAASSVAPARQRDGAPSPAGTTNAAGAGRLGTGHRYEPVRSEEGSFNSVNRPPSVNSDSSEAAGLRLLGNDGM